MMSEVEWMKIFAGNLEDLMRERRMSQRDVAEEANITQSTISKYINARQMPTVKALVNLSYALNCDFNDLIDFGDMIE